MNRISGAFVGIGLAVLFASLTGCGVEKIELTSQSVTIGQTPVVFGLPRGLPVHGPMQALRLHLTGEGYRRDVTKARRPGAGPPTFIYGRDGLELTITATLVGADGARSAFDTTMTDVFGSDSRTGFDFFLHHPRDGTSWRRPIHVEVVASVPVTVSQVQWITGDPSWGTWP